MLNWCAKMWNRRAQNAEFVHKNIQKCIIPVKMNPRKFIIPPNTYSENFPSWIQKKKNSPQNIYLISDKIKLSDKKQLSVNYLISDNLIHIAKLFFLKLGSIFLTCCCLLPYLNDVRINAHVTSYPRERSANIQMAEHPRYEAIDGKRSASQGLKTKNYPGRR